MDPREYELLIHALIGARLDEVGLHNVRVLHDQQHVGKASGHAHQIDVSFQLSIAGVSVLFLVECKHYNRRVGVDEVLEFASRVQDIGGHKGIIVTTKGFDPGAIKVARSHGIALVVANAVEWSTSLEFRGLPGYIDSRKPVYQYLSWALEIDPERLPDLVETETLDFLGGFSALSVRLKPLVSLRDSSDHAPADVAFRFIGEQLEVSVGPSGLVLLLWCEQVAANRLGLS